VSATKPTALLFDVGDVLMEHNWRLLELLCDKHGWAYPPRGPLAAPDAPDREWWRVEHGECTADEYWDLVSSSYGFATRIELWRTMSFELGGDVFAADAFALVDEARAAGIAVGILSNDLVRSAGRTWVDSRPEFAKFSAIIDATEFGQRKPAPAPYLAAAAALDRAPAEIVFLDDMDYCIQGARAVGMLAVRVDPVRRHAAFAEARRLVGLPSGTP
jgi:FMN phosphatase YigB (HAD superfamily)